jgi:hypothetical protein
MLPAPDCSPQHALKLGHCGTSVSGCVGAFIDYDFGLWLVCTE